ncbi:MAG TPA: MFS transporter [Planctomicrobium sp.]|nr:MFS transporter [Planctomicrobium sp.]
MTAILQRFLNIRRDEVVPLLVSGFFFFCLLTALMVLRPARDALGMTRGMDDIRWLFVGTAVVTLAVNPIFGWLVSRFRRISFITVTYAFFTLSLVGFYALLTLTPQAVGITSGQVFYVWFSVFNLFCTMIFWALMVDRFSFEQSKRLFGAIAVGGTLGAIAGPWLATQLAKPLGTPALLLVAAGFLVIAIFAAWGVVWVQPDRPKTEKDAHPAQDHDRAVIGGNAWNGISAVFQSKYLLGISGYMLILSVIATFLYFTRLQMVADLGTDIDKRTQTFAYIDLITQVATLALQLVAAGHIMKRFGVSAALALLPLIMALGFIGLAIAGSIAALIVLEVTFKAVQRAIMRPARETLFTVVNREEKYKSKAFTDTFVYRGGDVLGAWSEGVIGKIGMGLIGLASVAVPLSLAWGVMGIWLGRRQAKLAAAEAGSASIDDQTPDVLEESEDALQAGNVNGEP